MVVDLTGWICEAHPWLAWPHNDCPGPGMPKVTLDHLHEHARLISDDDYRSFRRLLFAARKIDALDTFTRPLQYHVPMADEFKEESHLT